MTDNQSSDRILLPEDSRGPRVAARPAPTGAWQLLATVGWAFLVVGAMDVGLVWYPTAFGNAGWEFGSVTAMLNGFPLPVMAVALLLASGVARADRKAAWTAMVVAAVFVAACGFAAVLYSLSLPLALQSVTDPIGRQGLLKAVVRSLVQLVVFPVVLITVMVRARRFLKAGDGK